MTQRERKLVFFGGGILGVIVLVAAFFQVLIAPLVESKKNLETLQEEQNQKLAELRKRRADRQEYLRLQALSLPADPDPRRLEYDLAWKEYDKYLRELLRAAKLKGGHISGTPPASRSGRLGPANGAAKKPLYTPLTFSVEAQGNLAGVVDLLYRIAQTPLLHRVQSVSIKPADAGSGKKSSSQEVAIRLTVEALLLQGAEKRPLLLPTDDMRIAAAGLTALAADGSGLIRRRPLVQATDPRQYAAIGLKNIFFAPARPTPPPTVPRREYDEENLNELIRLTSIVHRDDQWEACFYDVWNNINMRARARDVRALWGPRQEMRPAFRNIAIYDDEGERQSARVCRMDERDIYIWYDGNYYNIHIGETLAEAFKRGRLLSTQFAELGLPPEPEK